MSRHVKCNTVKGKIIFFKCQNNIIRDTITEMSTVDLYQYGL